MRLKSAPRPCCPCRQWMSMSDLMRVNSQERMVHHWRHTMRGNARGDPICAMLQQTSPLHCLRSVQKNRSGHQVGLWHSSAHMNTFTHSHTLPALKLTGTLLVANMCLCKRGHAHACKETPEAEKQLHTELQFFFLCYNIFSHHTLMMCSAVCGQSQLVVKELLYWWSFCACVTLV